MTWTINLDAATATHDSGLVVKFTPAPDAYGGFIGHCVATAPPASISGSAAELARIMREAGDAFIAARAARH